MWAETAVRRVSASPLRTCWTRPVKPGVLAAAVDSNCFQLVLLAAPSPQKTGGAAGKSRRYWWRMVEGKKGGGGPVFDGWRGPRHAYIHALPCHVFVTLASLAHSESHRYARTRARTFPYHCCPCSKGSSAAWENFTNLTPNSANNSHPCLFLSTYYHGACRIWAVPSPWLNKQK